MQNKLIPFCTLLALALFVLTAPARAQSTQLLAGTAGETLALTVTVGAGTPPLSYTWDFTPVGGTAATVISGATGPAYNIPNVQVANSGTYVCTITNSAGSTTTNLLVVTVSPPVVPPSGAALTGSFIK